LVQSPVPAVISHIGIKSTGRGLNLNQQQFDRRLRGDAVGSMKRLRIFTTIHHNSIETDD
jgi:hypothetical protein